MLSSTRNLQLFARHNGIALISMYSTDGKVPANVPDPRISSSQAAQFKKGAGGRSSFSGNVVTIFGANGRLGTAVVNELAKSGNQLIIPYRCDPYWVRELKVVGDLGQILFFPFDLKDEESIRKCLKYSNIVINVIGTRVNTKQFSMYETHQHGAKRIAKIATEMGVERLVHVSAMNADPNYKPVFYKKSNFLQSKGLGEIAVREEFPDAVIIRPSNIYDENDKFIYPILSHWRKNVFDKVYMWKAGEQTYKMPIYINDVALGIRKAALDPTVSGKTFEFVGPHCYKLGELVDYMFARARVRRDLGFKYSRHAHFDPWFWTGCIISQVLSRITGRDPAINLDWMEFTEGASDVLTGALTLSDLGINRLSEFEYLGGYHAFKRSFMEAYEEDLTKEKVDDPPLPLRSPPLYKLKSEESLKIQTAKKSFGVPFVPLQR